MSAAATRDQAGADGGQSARRRPMSLRARLMIGIALLITCIMLAGALFVVAKVPSRVETEVRPAMTATRMLFEQSVRVYYGSPRIWDEVVELVGASADLRHVRVRLLDPDGAEQAVSHGVRLPMPDVPQWFARLAGVRTTASFLPIHAVDRLVGTVVIESDPWGELAEAWHDTRDALLAMFGFCVLTGMFVYLVTGRALRPLELLAAAMRSVQSGDYRARAPEHGAREIAELGATFNHMADRLAESTAENQRMAERLVSLQEQERADLARDLHDDIGPSLFAVNLDAAALERSAKAGGNPDAAGRARSILDVVAHIQGQVRVMLGRLKPSGLDEFGLGGAIEGIAQFWRHRHPEVVWRLDLPEDGASYGETLDITAFRVVQEAATNALRHGRTRAISVSVSSQRTSDGNGFLVVKVADDGGGAGDELRPGFGLGGMRERVRMLGGSLEFINRPGEGLTVLARLPFRPAQQQEKMAS